MDKILKLNNFKIRYCKLTPKILDDKTKVKKDLIFYCNHTEKQSEDIRLKSNTKYIFLNNDLLLLDIDTYKGMQILYDFLNVNLNIDNISKNLLSLFKNKTEYKCYINKSISTYSIDIDELEKNIIKLNNDRILEEHSIMNIISYSYVFFITLKCNIDLTINGLIHMYFLPPEDFSFSHYTIGDIELISKSCVIISKSEHYSSIFSINEIETFNINLLKIFNIQKNLTSNKIKKEIKEETMTEDEEDDDEEDEEENANIVERKIKYINGYNQKIDKNDFIKEIRYCLIDIMPLYIIDDYSFWFKLIICLKTLNNKFNNKYNDELYDIFIKMSKRSSKYKSDDKKMWHTIPNKYQINEKYIYNILKENGLIKFENDMDEENFENDINILMNIYTFKYFDQIDKLVYRRVDSHYYIIKESLFSKLYYEIFKKSKKNLKNYIQNLMYNIISRVEHIGSKECGSNVDIFDYKDIIPFKDFIFDLNIKDIRAYTDNDYILYDVSYNFPLEMYNNSLIDENNLNQECIKAISDMFLKKEEEDIFWQCMSENLDRRCKTDSVIFLYGAKSNGKSSIFKVNSAAFGDLDVPVGATYLQSRSRKSGEPEYGRLLYAFYASIPEAPTEKIDSEVIKSNSSGDKMSFRMLYSNTFIQFSPSFRIMINCNTLPLFTQYDGGTRRRIQLIPFRVKFTKNIPKLSFEKKSDLKIRQQFTNSIEWRNTYMIKLILSYYKNIDNTYNIDLIDIIQSIDIINEKFLGYLFDVYKINDDETKSIRFDSFYTDYKSRETDLMNKSILSKTKVIEIFKSFDIIYDPIENLILNLTKL